MARLLARQIALAGDVAEAFDLADTHLTGRVRSGCPQSDGSNDGCLMAFTVRDGLAYVFGGLEGRERIDDLVGFALSAYPAVARLEQGHDVPEPERKRFGPVLVPALVQVTDLARVATAAAAAQGRRGGRAARLKAARHTG
ncbi:hypothetical protein [Pannonibacter sp.]|uniref:hypothetical protein n=1 Tax=Pannonibacter sp. TaxID=1906786 RepID=UPI003F71E600